MGNDLYLLETMLKVQVIDNVQDDNSDVGLDA